MSIFLEDKLFKVSILAVSGIGRKSFKQILLKLGALDVALNDFWHQRPKQIWKLCGLSTKQQHSLKKFQKRFTPEEYFGWVSKQSIGVLVNEDKEYPKLLNQIDDRPLVLYTKGDTSGVNQRPIAVVGTRQVSGYGRSVIGQIVPDLVAQQASIVSGFMYGVDTLSQKEAVRHDGYTVGVLGFGFDHLYPAGNKRFFQEMLAKGNCFLTEYPPWVSGHRGNFPERNRIVAGMSLATVVIEAAAESGSHITARLAGEYGRGVCAVPGPITNPYSEGTKNLINQGARLITSAKEILEEAGVFGSGWSKFIPEAEPAEQHSFSDLLQEKIYSCLLNGPSNTDQLSAQLSLPIANLNSSLSMLELEGLLERKNDVWFVKKFNSVQ